MGDRSPKPESSVFRGSEACFWVGTFPYEKLTFLFPHSFQPSFFSQTDRHFPRVFGDFLERFGSLERMEIEDTPRTVCKQKEMNHNQPELFERSTPRETMKSRKGADAHLCWSCPSLTFTYPGFPCFAG